MGGPRLQRLPFLASASCLAPMPRHTKRVHSDHRQVLRGPWGPASTGTQSLSKEYSYNANISPWPLLPSGAHLPIRVSTLTSLYLGSFPPFSCQFLSLLHISVPLSSPGPWKSFPILSP